jgi:catechol 2,3-dioxygenase-like lactoylglutathione lyase family enzyme
LYEKPTASLTCRFKYVKKNEKEKSMLISNLDHLVLTVKDITVSCDFYSNVLGLEIISFGGDRKALRIGNQKINLHQGGEEITPCAKHPTPGSADLCFITPLSINDFKNYLADNSVAVELGPVTRNGTMGEMTSLYLRDPDHNLIEISQYE